MYHDDVMPLERFHRWIPPYKGPAMQSFNVFFTMMWEPKQTVEKTIQMQVIYDVVMIMERHYDITLTS